MSNAPDQPRKALGKGLSALLPSNRGAAVTPPPVAVPVAPPTVQAAPVPPPAPVIVQAGPQTVSIDLIDANPLQPRTVFVAEKLAELAQSIKENGVIQPPIVRKHGERYQLVAGERRWRAAKMAGLDELPVIIQDFTDNKMMVVALIENIQREDLNPIEVAHSFERLARELALSHEQIAQQTGKDRSTISNMLRLLRLPHEVQLLVAEQRLSMGHARALLGLPTAEQQVELATKTAHDGLSVRQVEKMVQKAIEPPHVEEEKEPPPMDPNVKAAIHELERVLGTRVRIVEKSESRGRIELEYYSMDDLNRIYETIVGS